MKETSKEFRHIVRIAGKDLAGGKRVQLALADLKGVNVQFARAIVHVTGIEPHKKLGELSKEQMNEIVNTLSNPSAHGIPPWMLNRRKDFGTGKDKHLVGGDFTFAVHEDIARERRIRSRRGIRHGLGLSVRGQRTRTTGRKGLVIGVMRKEIRVRAEEAKAAKGKKEEKVEAPKVEKKEGAK